MVEYKEYEVKYFYRLQEIDQEIDGGYFESKLIYATSEEDAKRLVNMESKLITVVEVIKR